MTWWSMNNGVQGFYCLENSVLGHWEAPALSASVPKAELCQQLYCKSSVSTAFEAGEAVTSCDCHFISQGLDTNLSTRSCACKWQEEWSSGICDAEVIKAST